MNKKIDLSRYEGHTEGPWEYNTDDDGWTLAAIRERDDPDRDEFIVLITKPNGDPYLTMNPDLRLIKDAPLILDAYKDRCEEVKRLLEDVMFLVDLEEFSENERYLIDSRQHRQQLLKENERLREQLDHVRHWVSLYEDEHMMEMFKMWIGEEE